MEDKHAMILQLDVSKPSWNLIFHSFLCSTRQLLP